MTISPTRVSLAPLLLLCLSTACAAERTAASLWAEYAAAPDTHPVIPNCSYAGYRRGEAQLPAPAVVADVRAEGAKADGTSDDSAAFAAAIAKAAAAGGGAVLVPKGTYRLDGMVRLTSDNVVLRGEGSTASILRFHRPLDQVLGRMPAGGNSQWGWSGGLVWLGPADTFAADGVIAGDRGTEKWEGWRPGKPLASLAAPAARGDRVVTVDAAGAAALAPGMLVLMTWANPPDRSLLLAMAGHAAMRDYPWDKKASGLTGRPAWHWPVEIAAVDGARITLAQPLRIDARAEWSVRLLAIGTHLRGAGVEGLGLEMVGRKPVPHLKDPGWNGIYLNRAVHCWVRDVAIRDSDNGVIHAAAKHTTVTGLAITGGSHHHATALRVGSHDNLVSDFAIESQPRHGINTEALSTGNVWRRGRMLHGTFDSHRQMSFELIRTDITVHNDGSPGGADQAGPFLGARCVHWNVRLTGTGKYVNQPDCISDGALVGMQGPRSDEPAWAMVDADKNCVIADADRVPEPADLYQAQLDLRLRSLPSPAAATPPPGAAEPRTRTTPGGGQEPARR